MIEIRPVVAWARVWGNKTSNSSKGTLWGERIVQHLDSDGVYTDVYTCQNIHIRYVQFYVNYVSIKLILKEEKIMRWFLFFFSLVNY